MLALLVGAATKVAVYCLVLALGLWCWLQWKWRALLRVARKLPCTEKPHPVFGHAYFLRKGWEAYTKFFVESSIIAVSKQIYTVCAWNGPIPRVMIFKLEDIQKVLTSSCTAEKSDDYDYLKYWLGDGLVTAPGNINRITRRHISPLFHIPKIEQLMVVFNNNSRELVADLAEHVGGGPVDMLHPAMSVALKSVCQIIFGDGPTFDRKSKAFKDLMKAVGMIPVIGMRRICNPLLSLDFVFSFVYRNEFKEINRIWKNFTESPLKVAKQNYANKNGSNLLGTDKPINHAGGGNINLVDVLSEMQKKYPQFKEKYLKHEMVTLYATGTDTIGLAASSCLWALGRHLDIQDRVYEEISAVVGPDDDVTMDHIRRMQYLDQVYKETLRWATIVPYIPRRTTEDIKLGDCTLPANSRVIVGLVGPLMDPTIYPDPRQFDPDRWSPDNVTARAKSALIAFSLGNRMCIGKIYSEYLVKTMLVHVLRRYRLSTDMDIYRFKKTLGVTLVNSDGYNLKLTIRK